MVWLGRLHLYLDAEEFLTSSLKTLFYSKIFSDGMYFISLKDCICARMYQPERPLPLENRQYGCLHCRWAVLASICVKKRLVAKGCSCTANLKPPQCTNAGISLGTMDVEWQGDGSPHPVSLYLQGCTPPKVRILRPKPENA